MLTSRTVPRSRPLQAHTVINNVFGSSNTSLLRSRHRLQIRAFRFGMWSSYLDPAYHRELRRRHRTLKHKYADAINRRLSWHGHPLAEEPNLALKRVVARYWTPAAARCSSRWVNQDELDSRKARSYRPSYATFSFDAKSPQPDSWRSHIDQLFNNRFRQTSSDVKPLKGMEMKPEPSHMNGNTKTSKSQKKNRRERVSTAEEDYVIDPITNRKVPKRDHGSVEKDLEPQTPTFKTYRSQFTPFVPPELEQETPPVHSMGKPPAAELSKYAKSKFEDWPAVGIHSPAEFTESPVYPEAASYVFDNSALKNEEYALNHLPLDDPIEEYDDLHKYRPRVSDEALEKSSDIHDKGDVVDTVDPSGTHFDPSCQSVLNPDQLQIELQSYGPYIYNENLSEHISPEEPKDLEKYRYHVSEGPELPAKPSTVYDDLHKYRPTSSEEIKDHDQPFEQYGDLEKYEAFRHQGLETIAALERDTTTESLKEYEAKEQDERVPDVIDTYIQDGLGKLPKMKLPEGHFFSKHYSGETGAGATHPSRDNGGDRKQLHQHMKKLSETSDAVDREINSNLRKSRQEFTNDQSANPQRNLTGNFVQDFPEEFQQTWNVHEGGLMPGGNQSAALESPHDQEVQSRIQNAEKKYSENLSSSTNEAVLQPTLDRLRISSRLEPALKRRASAIKGDRLNRAFGADLHSKEPQGLETSFSEECGGRHTMPLYTRTYGSEPGQVAARSKPTTENEIPVTPMPSSSDFSYHRDPEIDGIPPLESTESPRGQKATHSEEPTVYKILAYDPTMQTINIAETTSVVPDQASPLSPTEVLLRLSNPTKFFPHFAPLQAEGFEIVSGSGDVLVFRQVRPAKAAARGSGPPVNPIDMMGRPIALPSAAAFVSPTGFVNYDIPRVEEELTEPAFRSNIDVRREEPVFSGQKSSASDKKSKKPRMNVGKRILIGGAWVAGISYALGVVSEYFTTGGVDGKGPTGF
ncbi:hypothetical protein HD806DRAFT_480789 [Xylariaceae sp. AK1471]|nr:hypothetical protein HD806DRAFT_480789 [Xylariaceae sp. AK1471]